MGCEQWREVMSAQLDGEETAAERAAVDEHLSGCAACRGWLDRAAAVTRRTRTGAVTPLPDLTDTILAAVRLPVPRRLRDRLVVPLRAALGLLGAVQLVLGLAQIGRGAVDGHDHGDVTALAAGHLWHESAAWNVAVGAGFLFVALRRTPPAGLLPTLTAFVAALALLSINDLITARVAPQRLVSHGFLVAGYLITLALSHPALRPGDPPRRACSGGSRWQVRFDDIEDAADRPALRLVPPHSAQVTDRWAA